MATNGPEPTPPKKGGLWGRLFGVKKSQKTEEVVETDKPADKGAETAPTWETVTNAEPIAPLTPPPLPPPLPEPAEVPTAVPIAELVGVVEATEDVVPAMPVETAPAVEDAPAVEAAPVVEAEAQAPQLCQVCSSPRKGKQAYCDDCGWFFPPDGAAPAPVRAPVVAAAVENRSTPTASTAWVKDRYELGPSLGERGEVARFQALDHGAGNGQPTPVMVLRAALPEVAMPLLALDDEPTDVQSTTDDEELLPSFEEPMPTAQVIPDTPGWPSIPWVKSVLENASHPALPRLLDHFIEGEFEYLIEEVPAGRSLWDAWDDPDYSPDQRYGFLQQIAEGMHALHQAGALLEAIRPDIVVVTESGQPRLADLSDLLPLPVPPNPPLRANLYTAPELVLSPEQADARAGLYSFGAMIYALEYLHHELTEADFERQFSPRLITDRCPDVHPLFFRLVSKTFVRDPNTRFPSDEAIKEDASGFTELIRTLGVCRRVFDSIRMDMAAWTTTGMVRTGNEDAFAVLHAVESCQDDLNEYALILLADGMGGYEAGEVAAAMTLHSVRKFLLGHPMFAALAGDVPPEPGVFEVEACKKILGEALRNANKEVWTASRAPGGKRGMGCTAEAVYVDGKHLVVSHVGDSRTYHLHQGRLIQLTRDQTLVNRLVELGRLTPEEAENHPQKNQLQQAVGGQPDVEPGLYQGLMKRGDWVLVCSDGLTNHIPPEDLQKMLLREATSAEEACRRLLNLVNLRGATDNATLVVIHAV
jgi:serine/threonine protein phosphatase PrpC